MNLVDAIRMATQKHSAEGAQGRRDAGTQGHGMIETQPPTPNTQHPTPEGAESNQTKVRFELLLSEQQFADLLRWLTQTMHAVMTLREAARYLRLRQRQVQVLAERGDLPTLRVDGNLRFVKTALDEWLLTQAATAIETTERRDAQSPTTDNSTAGKDPNPDLPTCRPADLPNHPKSETGGEKDAA